MKCLEKVSNAETFLGVHKTMFLGISLVEVNFLLVKWAKDDYSNVLKDFSLESILHANFFHQLDWL